MRQNMWRHEAYTSLNGTGQDSVHEREEEDNVYLRHNSSGAGIHDAKTCQKRLSQWDNSIFLVSFVATATLVTSR